MTKIQTLLKQSKFITVLTGAGVSTNSGIPDFKSTDESWPHREPRHQLISLPFFYRNPTRFWKIYRETFQSTAGATSNSAHEWIAGLEESHDTTIVTQNIDGLHQTAGSSKVLEVHGNNLLAECLRCKNTVPMDTVADQELPRCGVCRKPLKPAVVLFSENVRNFDKARQAVLKSDLLIVMGASLDVFPVNELPLLIQASSRGRSLWVNKSEPPIGYNFDETWIGDLSDFPLHMIQ